MSGLPDVRKLHFTALQNLHIKCFGSGFTGYEELTAHGSDRIIIRLNSETESCIGIVNPHIKENRAFISFGKIFRKNGLNVPEIFAIAKDDGSYLLEDLGDETLFIRVASNWSGDNSKNISLYKKAIDEMPKFQVSMAGKIDFNMCYQFGEFGEDNIDFDINYFKERFLKALYKNEIDENLLNNDLEFLKGRILEMPRDFFLYRDFQSRNIMLKDEELYFIDFQSGRRGSLLYDIASLLFDARADIPQEIREELLEYYLLTVDKYVTIDIPFFSRHFWYFALIRILQAMGAYGFLGMVKGKTRFLESIPYALKNINFILNRRIPANELNYLKNIFSELLEDNNPEIQKQSTSNDKT
jgi:aminoglycoside/choline kinase family phosphotransferase